MRFLLFISPCFIIFIHTTYSLFHDPFSFVSCISFNNYSPFFHGEYSIGVTYYNPVNQRRCLSFPREIYLVVYVGGTGLAGAIRLAGRYLVFRDVYSCHSAIYPLEFIRFLFLLSPVLLLHYPISLVLHYSHLHSVGLIFVPLSRLQDDLDHLHGRSSYYHITLSSIILLSVSLVQISLPLSPAGFLLQSPPFLCSYTLTILFNRWSPSEVRVSRIPQSSHFKHANFS